MNSVRITSGIYRGRKILTPGGGTHPMGERERLALFNMIAGVLPGSRVLDAFSGSGALGIEALSRGASMVVMLEKSAKAGKIIKENLQSLALEAEVHITDVVNFTTDEKFDLVIADPPYDDFDVSKIEYLTRFLDKNGLLVLSHPGEAPELENLTLQKSRSYAGATISVYKLT